MANKKPLTKRRKAEMEQKAKREKQKKLTIMIVSIVLAVLVVGGVVGLIVALNYEAPPSQYYAEIQIKNVGALRIELDTEKAPKAAGKFIELANKGTYNGKSFYSLENGKLYGGDKEASVAQILGEFNNGLTNTKGVISMAKSSVNTVNPALFYINLENDPQSDKESVEFGKVISGLDLLDGITVTEESNLEIEKITIIEK